MDGMNCSYAAQSAVSSQGGLSNRPTSEGTLHDQVESMNCVP